MLFLYFFVICHLIYDKIKWYASFKGFAKYGNDWYYVVKVQLQLSYSGTIKYNNMTYNIRGEL